MTELERRIARLELARSMAFERARVAIDEVVQIDDELEAARLGEPAALPSEVETRLRRARMP